MQHVEHHAGEVKMQFDEGLVKKYVPQLGNCTQRACCCHEC